jgi:capsular exopolysaccharide synthesis family protein
MTMEAMHESAQANIGDYLSVLRRRWLVILGTMTVIVVLVAAKNLAATPVYQASTQMLLQPTQSESIFQPGVTQSDPTRAVQNELKIINSLRVRNAVREAYGSPVAIDAASGGEDDIIILSATDTDPEEAARKVNVYAETYQETKLNATVAELAQSKEVLQQQVDDYQAEIDALIAPIAEIDQRIVDTPVDSPEYAQLVVEREALNNKISAERNELQASLSDYQQRLQVLQLSERLTTTGGVQILNPATVPGSPISPNMLRDLVQAALIGLFLGIGLALLLEQIDDSIRTVGDLERSAKDLPTLGLVPEDEGWRNRDVPRVSTKEAPMSATAEAYRGLRTTLQYLALHRPMGVVQLTSASASEGKTSTLANLAYAFAEAGMPVAVVGCDLRRPRIHAYLGVDGSIGLTSVLLGERTLEDAIQQSPLHPNIKVLPSGPRPPNPSELLSLDRTANLIRSLLDDHAIVFLDCPPVLPVTDSLVLSRCVDASMFIAMSSSTSKRQVKRSIERLRQVDSPLIGTILNGVSAEGAYGSLYEYYGYQQPSKVPFLGKLFKRSVPDVPALEAASLPTEDELAGRTSEPSDGDVPEGGETSTDQPELLPVDAVMPPNGEAPPPPPPGTVGLDWDPSADDGRAQGEYADSGGTTDSR